MKDSDSSEHRKKERIPYNKEIVVNDTILVRAIDISKGGVYIHTSHSFEPGSVVEVSLPFRDKMLKIMARVKHAQTGVGMGLMFIDLDDMKIAQIQELIDDITKKPPKPKTEKPTVLFVEDDDMSRKMIKNKLNSEGLWVIEAENGIEAIKALKEQSVDVILLDLFMRKMDGFKVLSIIRESPEWKHVPVVVLSAQGTDEVIDKAMSAGADQFLLKMVTPPAKLAEVIKTIIKQQKSEEE